MNRIAAPKGTLTTGTWSGEDTDGHLLVKNSGLNSGLRFKASGAPGARITKPRPGTAAC